MRAYLGNGGEHWALSFLGKAVSYPARSCYKQSLDCAMHCCLVDHPTQGIHRLLQADGGVDACRTLHPSFYIDMKHSNLLAGSGALHRDATATEVINMLLAVPARVRSSSASVAGASTHQMPLMPA